jgi:thiosulfate dehydrogenase [quinone] large subunit
MKRDDLMFVLLRISLGFIFLWAFIDKVFGLGLATAREGAWIAGASPTMGFLKFGTAGPLSGMFQAVAGNVVVDWLFMLGLLLIGACLILGIFRRVAGYSGALLMLLMWSAVLPPAHHPFLDEHIIYLLVLLLLAGRKTKFSLEDKLNKLLKK